MVWFSVYHGGEWVFAACHQHIQEGQSPFFLPVDGELYVGGQLVQVCVEQLQLLLSMWPDDKGIIHISQPGDRQQQPKEEQGTLHIPYIRGLSESLEKACAPLGVKAIFKPKNTLKQLFVKVKQTPEEKKEQMYTNPLKGLQQGVHCRDKENHEDKSDQVQTSCKKG